MKRLLARAAAMPRGLNAIFAVCLICGPLMILLAVLPWGMRTFQGSPVSHAEFWRTGGGLVLCASGVLMAGIARGIYKRSGWVRIVLPLLCLSAAFVDTRHLPPRPLSEWILAVIVGAGVFWYFICKRSVRAYFRQNGEMK